MWIHGGRTRRQCYGCILWPVRCVCCAKHTRFFNVVSISWTIKCWVFIDARCNHEVYNRTHWKENACSALENKEFHRRCNECHAKGMTDVTCNIIISWGSYTQRSGATNKLPVRNQNLVLIAVNNYRPGTLRPALRRCNWSIRYSPYTQRWNKSNKLTSHLNFKDTNQRGNKIREEGGTAYLCMSGIAFK